MCWRLLGEQALERITSDDIVTLCYAPPPQVAIKKVLQDKRFKNRELQIMKMMDHPNVVDLRHCFFTNEKAEARPLLPTP